ncbi:hypothetical protein IV471_01050 [Enterococcus gallinarum]|uniref:hypothetical protein n=1 Tax=Enterococcus gallinarum TaxID=1353 RepID=UPI001E2E7C55|nr:hypothetical protein [Enterococcus gallinarum]MCD5183882.1 hypothetical protein [Enterococcus gallinarum]
MSKKQELKNYVVNSIVHNAFDPNELLRLINLLPDQPQLNEQQQIAINNAKKSFEKGADLYDCAIDMMLYDGLTDKEWAKATVAFLLWAQKQEEE